MQKTKREAKTNCVQLIKEKNRDILYINKNNVHLIQEYKIGRLYG